MHYTENEPRAHRSVPYTADVLPNDLVIARATAAEKSNMAGRNTNPALNRRLPRTTVCQR